MARRAWQAEKAKTFLASLALGIYEWLCNPEMA